MTAQSAIIIDYLALDDLDPFELALYAAYRRACAEGGGSCDDSIAAIAKAAKMSAGKASGVARSLAEKNYITITTNTRPGTQWIESRVVRIVDRGASLQCSGDEHQPVKCSPDERSVQEMNTHGEPQCSPDEHDHIKESLDLSKDKSLSLQPIGCAEPPKTAWGQQIGLMYYYIERQGWTRSIIQVQLVGETPKRVKIKRPDGRVTNVKPDSIHEEPPSLERTTTPMQDVIAEFGFGIAPDRAVDDRFVRTLEGIERQIMTPYPALTVEHLRAAFEATDPQYRPSKTEGILKMLSAYRERTNGQRPARRPARPGAPKRGTGGTTRAPARPPIRGYNPAPAENPARDKALLAQVRARRTADDGDGA